MSSGEFTTTVNVLYQNLERRKYDINGINISYRNYEASICTDI